jgi:diguanylate cyclase (GGDEF)-like protein/putative nucleotidyltransferase with HDIG domain
MDSTTPESIGRVDRVRALVEVSRLRAAGSDLDALLRAVARTVSRALGFRCVIINFYRPAWNDFEVVEVHGSAEARDALLGERSSPESWDRLLHPRFQRGGAYLIPAGEGDWPEDEAVFVPDLPESDDPAAWRPEDALFAPMAGPDGETLGYLSADLPESGRRPAEEDLEVLSAIATHAGAMVADAQAAARAVRHQAALDQLMQVSVGIEGREDAQAILREVCRGVRDALGFERVAVFLAAERGDDWLQPCAEAGWGGLDRFVGGLSKRAIAPLWDPRFEREGCSLLSSEQAAEAVPAEAHLHASTRNGRGPRAWSRHWLTVALHAPEGELIGVLWPDDPRDRLLPGREQLQALRLLANQAAAALESARRMELLRHLAEHDPLTGLRNRRDLGTRIDAEVAASGGPVSLLLCDLDHFKRVNDCCGHEAGDRALARFADLLRECARPTDTAARLGGEEFALVLPATDARGALTIAERVRLRMASFFADELPELRVSIGIATSGEHGDSAQALLFSADKALYAAKRLGRDRCITFDAELVDRLTGPRPDGEGDLVAAVVLLAETLDVRDAGITRHSNTVGRYAELIARELAWEPRHVERMRIAGVLHDVGKIGVSDATLRKAGPLNAAERAELERHCDLGAQIVAGANLPDVAAWIVAHHERLDGRGYPQALGGDEICAEARILAVADAYEAMIAGRPYRDPMGADEARAELRRGAATGQFDPLIVDAFITALARGSASVPSVVASN